MLQGLSIQEQYFQHGSVLSARVGVLHRQIQTPISTGTSYFLPSAVGLSVSNTAEGQDYFDSRPWGDKSYFVQADQSVEVDVQNSEDGGNTWATVAGLSVSSGSFVPGQWNSIESTLMTSHIRLCVITKTVAPVEIQMVARLRKQ